MIDFLFVSNGYGEDAIAAKIAEFLSPASQVAGFPLVGNGLPYRSRNVRVLGDFPALPGAGVSLAKDLGNGLFLRLRHQWSALAALRGKVRHAVCVGDIFPCFLARFALRAPFSFVGTAKTNWVQPYHFLERGLLRKASTLFVRDEKTAAHLRKQNVPAQWAGNPMMDEVMEEKIVLPAFQGRTIAVLPGSRSEAVQNFFIQVEALTAVARTLDARVRGIVAVPQTVAPTDFLAKLSGWDGFLRPGAGSGILGELGHGEVSLVFVSGCLGDALRASSLVFGQAGTANEQAAGLGKPVLAFDFNRYRNGKLSWYRWRQERLLGKALSVVRPNAESLAGEAVELFSNRARYEAMSEAGKTRMGPPGGAQKIAEALRAFLNGSV